MGFLNPWLLIALAGVAVPVIIHLLNRFRHRQVMWGAMELLRRAIVLRSREIQLEDLLLRCLAVALLALAAARPTITSSGASWFGTSADVGMLILIDGSFSMDHRPGVQSRFSHALTKARELLQTAEPAVVWLNGKKVLQFNGGAKPNDKAEVTLAVGVNRIFVKAAGNAQQWTLALLICTEQGHKG